jgi:UDP-N-acetyl-D-glucosamine dehydrogenase
VAYADPYVPTIEFGNQVLYSVGLTPELLCSVDCVVVLTDHSGFDYAMIAAHSPLIVDSRNAFKDFPRLHIVRL